MDLFAGTGAVSFEFVSRGAKDVTSIDINNACTEYIKSAARQMNISNIRVVRADVFDLLKRAYKKFDLIFADPPYALQDLPNLPDSFEDHPHFWQHRAYGKVNFTFFANKLDE